MIEVQTKRLVLKELGKEDVPELFKIYSDEKTMKYTDTDTIRSIDEIEYEIDFVNKLALSGKGVRLGIFRKIDKVLIGTVGYHKWNKNIHKAEIGFEIGSSFWRKGYMNEVMPTMVSYGFTTMELNRIEALVIVDNFKSTKLLEKFGFKKEGVLRENTIKRMVYQNEFLYALLKKDWMSEKK
jgi:ribosomal-protein-alanine N-acetyltransferase